MNVRCLLEGSGNVLYGKSRAFGRFQQWPFFRERELDTAQQVGSQFPGYDYRAMAICMYEIVGMHLHAQYRHGHIKVDNVEMQTKSWATSKGFSCIHMKIDGGGDGTRWTITSTDSSDDQCPHIRRLPALRRINSLHRCSIEPCVALTLYQAVMRWHQRTSCWPAHWMSTAPALASTAANRSHPDTQKQARSEYLAVYQARAARFPAFQVS